jgi:hypothetical protein
MQDFEKLGAFYLGKKRDEASGKATEEIVLYDSGDLTTHAVIIGMTGSGKTGLGIGLIEEAALDHVPVIAIDPKGDMGNLLLSFPELAPADFEPWVDARAATAAGQTIAAFAASTAATWKKGLAQSGQGPDRIKALKKAADFAIYTPGSTAGLPLAVLGQFSPPPAELRDDLDLLNERITSTVDSLLALLGIEADPVTSPEHILLCNILSRRWADGASLSLADLIGAIQDPGFDKLGVMDLESFYPAKQRFALAMRINGLLAAPGFEVWMEGDLLEPAKLFYSESGKPRVSVVSIAHLNDAQRMFFVTLLLSEIIAWMRMQSGSSSLRAILYMDEIFGYLPPVANPPSKQLFLTLLKQARAYGLGLVLSTQNPVDLDYKALSNCGTWFIGRLQTDRDKQRLREGLETAAGAGAFGRGELDDTLSGLGKRQFLLHNVHEKSPVVFMTRWVMSYLAGPMTRDQIKVLVAKLLPEKPTPSGTAAGPTQTKPSKPAAAERPANAAVSAPPVLPPDIRQCFLPGEAGGGEDESTIYRPALVAAVGLYYSNATLNLESSDELMLALEFDNSDLAADWEEAEELEFGRDDIQSEPVPGAKYLQVPSSLASSKKLTEWERSLKRWLRAARPLTIWRSARFKLYSIPGETEAEFRIRLQHSANEARDIKVAQLKGKYETKVARIEDRLQRARQALEREAEQARGAKVDTALSIGTAVLGALLGRKRLSTTSVNRAGTAVRKAGSASKQAGDVKRAKETIASLEQKLADLAEAFDQEIEALDDKFDAQDETLTEKLVRPKSTDIDVRFFGIGWIPVTRRD